VVRPPNRAIRSAVVLAVVLTRFGVAAAASAVTVQAAAAASTLDVDGEGSASTHVVKVADVSLTGDGANGLTVYVTGASLTSPGGQPIAFQVLLVVDGAPAPSASDFTTPAGSTYVFSTGAPGTIGRDLYIKYTPAALQDPGAYTATIDLNVVDN
jgi:hypothetical protein